MENSLSSSDTVQVEIVLHEFFLFNVNDGPSLPEIEHEWIRTVQFKAPLDDLRRLHQLPLDSETLNSFKEAMEDLGNHMESEIKLRIQQECNLRPVGSASATDVLISVEFHNPVPYNVDGSTNPAAADEGFVNNLERFAIDDDGGPCCTVCLVDLKPGNEGLRLPCGHVFHEHCVVEWLAENYKCPICRHELPSNDH